jgi:transposase
MSNHSIAGAEISGANNRTDAVVPPPVGVIKLGIDVHGESYVGVRQVEQEVAQPAQRFKLEGLLGFVRRQVAVAQAVHSCYEAGPFGYVLHRQLTRLGVRNVVVRPRNWATYGERVKTDQGDAAALCSCLDRYVAGNRRALAVVRVPTEAEEQARAEGRQRQSLQKHRVRLILQGRSAALLRGCKLPREWWTVPVLARLAGEVPADLHRMLQRWQGVIVVVETELEGLSRQLEQAAPQGVPIGLGAMSWELIGREVGDWHRFHNRRQVASYTGLCPSEHSSGHSRQQGAITRHGNPRLRHLLIEAVWRLWRFNPEYHALVKWRPSLGAQPLSKARKKKIIVAVARQLAVDLWRLNTGRIRAVQLGLQLAA